MDFNNKVMETLTAITENNEEDKQDLANLKQALIDGTFNVKYLTWAIMATNDENGNRIIDTYATIERLTQVLEALTQEISDRKAADDLEKNERKEETTAIINSVNQEISDRTNAVSVLNNLITAETENRASEDEKVLQYAQSVNEALGNAKTDLQGKIDSEAQTRLTSDNEIKASITSKEDSLKALINSVKNELNGSITTLNNRVNNLPTNYVFDTYESMTNDLLNASNTKYKVGDTLFIKEVNKPDYWVSAILSTKGTYGYYELSEQESKVDLSNYVKISELSREAIEEKFLETVENGTKSFAARSFTATNKNSGIDVNNYAEYGYNGVSFRKNGVKYPIAFPQKQGIFALTSDIPQALKNPFALTINGEVYDGSSAVSITTETITEHDFVRFWHAGIEIQNDGSEHVLRLSDFDTELEEFSPHISCQYDGPQYYWVWKFPQISGTFAMESQIPTKLSQLTNDGNYQTNTSDLKDNTTTFTTASSRSNVASGEKLSVSFGKIAKYFNDLKAIAFSGDRADIGLGNVDNTSDANKPVSNATQQALNLKANSSDVYTKTETDGLLNDKANSSDVYTKSETDAGLNKSLYNLGAYDTISGNVITRQTGYYVFSGTESWTLYKNDFWYTEKISGLISNTLLLCSNGINVVCYNNNQIRVYLDKNPSITTSTDMNSVFASGVMLQYKLSTTYTEEIIEGQPLITLDQQGSQWLRDEWEKGLNLFDGLIELGLLNTSTGQEEQSSGRWRSKNYLSVKPNTTYVVSNFDGGPFIEYGINKTFVKSKVLNNNETFTTSSTTYYLRFYSASSNTNIMLNEGDHPYPYQAYNGKIVHDKDIADLYKQEYNLGYYDTMVENSDGTYTITRQTGYIVLDGVVNKFGSKGGSTKNNLYYYSNITQYVEKPSSTAIFGNIICNRFQPRTFDYIYNNNVYGITLYTDGRLGVGLTTSISTLDDANAYLVQNPISIQYKLATATTEKVEKNHYARYNERFILEHNKSEAERSATEGKVVHEKDLENITPGIFSLVGNNVDTLTISKNETYFIVSVAVNPIYVEGNSGISFIGSSLVTTVGMLSGDPKICINGSAYTLDNNSVTLKTSGLMKVYKVNY